jgi:hypothetical protein
VRGIKGDVETMVNYGKRKHSTIREQSRGTGQNVVKIKDVLVVNLSQKMVLA